ncbi:MAG: hypothetical protein P9L99_05470 [Candidatus Lernaella stagnicola]|nr:hypothetical protein [Candidatus Lernaella stagnicola]
MSNRKMAVLVVLVAIIMLTISFACEKKDDNNHDEDEGDDDISPIDDDWEIGCEGAKCNDGNVQPRLLALELTVNGDVREYPATVLTTDYVKFVIEYLHPHRNLRHGYPFIVVDGVPQCLEGQQFLNFTSSSEEEGPAQIVIDPHYFLDGEGAPYGFEISDFCGKHSNRIPVDIIAHRPGETNDDDDDEKEK